MAASEEQARPTSSHIRSGQPSGVGEIRTYNDYLLLDLAARPENATVRGRYEALARLIRSKLAERWLSTQETYDRENPKWIYYLSMEFLIGRSLANNVINFGLAGSGWDDLRSQLEEEWEAIEDAEPDAGLGNGGLGRLAACFIDSMATMQLPAMGYGLRYEYGIFRQEIVNGYQSEQPDHWLQYADPWEVRRLQETVQVPMNCSFRLENGVIRTVPNQPTHLQGVPYDRPVVGYGGACVNTLRLWSAASPDFFNFGEFSSGDFVASILDRTVAETVSRVLYPDDSTVAGQALRFIQEYFLVCCSLADIVARFRTRNEDWRTLPQKVAIQLNDTHPAIAVAELMRILLDVAHLGWDEAWNLTIGTLAYTNHTLLPEALEKWPVRFFETVCPRLLEIIYEVNSRFLAQAAQRFGPDDARLERVSLIEESPVRQIRMANLAIVGTHSTNGVAAIHSNLLRTRVVSDFAELFPDRFNNKTNGVTPRRWLLAANPELAALISEAIGDNWITDLGELRKLTPLAADTSFQERFRRAKRRAKVRFAAWLQSATGHSVDPDSIFDSQIKRIHEYKRQLLNVLHIVVLYNQLRENPNLQLPKRTFFFAGKAAPAYQLAKTIIKLIGCVSQRVDAEPCVRDTLKVVFLPDYKVSLAERLIPASDVSEQISTAGYEASGTGNMKFMMNGALTIGTRDGATIEMAVEAGEENFFLFGLTAQEVAASRGWYNPHWHYENESSTRQALDLIFSDYFNQDEPGIFEPIRDALLTRGDYFMHLADLSSYTHSHQQLGALYANQDEWVTRAIINVASSGKFSSDRTIQEYATEIWGVEPCPIS